MNKQSFYEINILHMMALWLVRWKLICCLALTGCLLALGFVTLTFQAPSPQSPAYQEIESAITQRRYAEQQLQAAQARFRDNLYYSMDPEKIVTKRLTLAVSLEDPSQVTDQTDPTDTVLYAYYNLARTQLQGSVLVPEVLSKAQQEQLLSIYYDNALNILGVTMTADDEALVDAVLAICADWYRQQTPAVSSQTYGHTLSTLPVSETVYDLEARAEMVSTVQAEVELQTLAEEVQACNTLLDQLFSWPAHTASRLEPDALYDRLEEQKLEDSKPHYLSAVLSGILLGAAAAILWISLPVIGRQKLLGSYGVAQTCQWQYLGRLNALPAARDLLKKTGYRMLFPDPQNGHAVQEMAALLLEGRDGLHSIGLVGNVPQESLARVRDCLLPLGLSVDVAQLSGDPVPVHRICRRADAVIFVGAANQVTTAETESLQEILTGLEKTPLGYVLV